MDVYSIVGWAGAIIFIVAYLLLSMEKLSTERPLYHFLNAAGAICLVINAIKFDDFPNILVNGVWAIIAFYAVFRILVPKPE